MNTARPLPLEPSRAIPPEGSPSETLAAANATTFALGADSSPPSGVTRRRTPVRGPGSAPRDDGLAAAFPLSLEQAAALVDEKRPGRFEFQKRLGNGAMGTVFLVYDREFEIHVAIKLVADDPRAKREGCATAAVRDLRIVTVRDMFVCRSYLAIVMEYVPGVPLDVAFGEGRLARDFPTLLRIAREVSAALACLHGAEVPIVHRDLKGANVLFTNAGEIRVLDFGLNVRRPRDSADDSQRVARAASKATWGAVGTPTTMAPEQCFSPADVGPHSDVFAFGAMFYDFAAGVPPHEGDTAAEVVAKKDRTPVSLAVHRPDLPPAFCVIIDACLTIDWRARVPQDGVQLHAALLDLEAAMAPPAPRPYDSQKGFVAVSSLAAPRVETSEATPRTWKSRRAAMVTAAALGLLALATGAIERPHGASAATMQLAGASIAPEVRVEGVPVATPARVAVLGPASVATGSAADADSARVAERIAAALEIDGPRVLHPSDAVRGAIGEKIAAAHASRDGAALAPLGATGITYAILGSVRNEGARAEAKLDVVDVKTGATVASVTGHAGQARFDELMDRLDGAVRALFSLPALDADGAMAVRRALPEGADAAREYVRALDLLARGELRSARGKLVAIGDGEAKGHARTQLLIAEIAHQVGAEAEAKTYAERARGLVSALSERERLPVEARAELASGNAGVALAKLKALGGAHRTIEDTVRFAEAAYEATKDEDGLAALHELETFGEVFASDAYVMQLKAALAWTHDDTENTLAFARKATDLAGERIAVRAQAKRLEASALYLRSGDTPDAYDTSEEAMSLLLALDDVRDAASLYLARGDAKYNGMDFAGATKQYRSGLELNGVSNSPLGAKFLQRIAVVEWKLGHYPDAERMFGSLIANDELDDVSRGYTYLYGAACAREQGHLTDASRRLDKAQELLGERDPTDAVLTLEERSALERARGRMGESLSLARKAFRIASTEAREFQATAMISEGWAYLALGRASDARLTFEKAIEEARRVKTRVDEDEACRGLAKSTPARNPSPPGCTASGDRSARP